jgi:hypothetical protein
MKYLKEQEQKHQQAKQSQQQMKEINRATESMKLYQINCPRLNHCKRKESPHCFYCTFNRARPANNPPVDYFQPKIPGIKFLGE